MLIYNQDGFSELTWETLIQDVQRDGVCLAPIFIFLGCQCEKKKHLQAAKRCLWRACTKRCKR